MKALDILNNDMIFAWEYIPMQGKLRKDINEAIEELKNIEARIAELEDTKSCDGCAYEHNHKTIIDGGCDIDICALCKRGTNDYYEPKDSK
jgi:multimeric flavodoxin WrbA